jgi:hypothetical protein
LYFTLYIIGDGIVFDGTKSQNIKRIIDYKTIRNMQISKKCYGYSNLNLYRCKCCQENIDIRDINTMFAFDLFNIRIFICIYCFYHHNVDENVLIYINHKDFSESRLFEFNFL